jgi:hypothetical protein
MAMFVPQLAPTMSAPRLDKRARGELGPHAHHRAEAPILDPVECHRRDDERSAGLARRPHRRDRLLDGAHRFDDDPVGAAGEQRVGLLQERVVKLVDRPVAERLEQRARGTDIAEHENARRDRPSRELRAAPANGLERAGQVVTPKHPGVGAERVREDEVGAGLRIGAMDRFHAIGLFEVPHLAGPPGRQPRPLELGPHRAVTQQHAAGAHLDKDRRWKIDAHTCLLQSPGF